MANAWSSTLKGASFSTVNRSPFDPLTIYPASIVGHAGRSAGCGHQRICKSTNRGLFASDVKLRNRL